MPEDYRYLWAQCRSLGSFGSGVEMDQARPLLGPATLRCRADPNGPSALFVLGIRVVIDHCGHAAFGEVRSWVGDTDNNYRACALGWRPPVCKSIVTAEHRVTEAVPIECASFAVIAGEHDRTFPLARR